MIVDVSVIAPEGEVLCGSDPCEVLQIDEEDVRCEVPVSYDLKVSIVSGRLIADGRLWTEVKFRCSRCAEFFRLDVKDSAFKCVVDILANVQTVDLTEEMREAIILAFPIYGVCRNGCKGLCASCGMNLNSGECDCREETSGPWDVLDELETD